MWRVKRGELGWGLLVLLLLPAASDFAAWSYWRQQLQIVSDDAATRAVGALMRGRPMEPAVRRGLPESFALAAPPEIEHPPRDGYFTAHPLAVRVRVSRLYTPFFFSKFVGPLRMTAQGTSAAIPDSSAERDAGRPCRVIPAPWAMPALCKPLVRVSAERRWPSISGC